MPAANPVVRTVAGLREVLRGWRQAGETVGLVPTMGALHEGHLALVHAARAAADRVVATIFINPAQFGPEEDLERYPRDEAADLARLEGPGVDLVFAPAREEVYPAGFSTSVLVGELADDLEGRHRPGHLAGVATVVAKLLLQAMPDRAFFGEKDYQQLLVVRRMARDLDIPTEIVGVETVREADGLALSSRNRYLSENQRISAGRLNRILADAATALRAGTSPPEAEAGAVRALEAAGFDPVDYVAIRDGGTLGPPEYPDRPARILAAARLGRTRLIDNLAV